MPTLIRVLIWIMIGICLIVWLLLRNIKPVPKSQFKQRRYLSNLEEYEPRKDRRYPSTQDEYEPPPSSYPQRKSVRSSKDYRYLITLLNGDEDGAKRLVRNIENVYPDRNTQSCIEKAVSDILRDRR